MAYLLDANVFISAKNLHYRFEFCPAFWDWVLFAHQHGRVFSIEKVGDELAATEDRLADWAATLGQQFFLKPDKPVVAALEEVSAWVGSQQYSPAAVNTFLQVADYYLIAHALAHGHTVVAHEKPERSIRRIKIPSVCIGLQIKHVSPFDMLQYERAKFVMGN
jgi:hypothetical protein